jgi:hypothetical protein
MERRAAGPLAATGRYRPLPAATGQCRMRLAERQSTAEFANNSTYSRESTYSR